MPKHELTWKEAIIKVLEKATEPLHTNEITARIKAEGFRHSLGATPEATVGAQIYMSIKNQGNQSPFIQVAKQTFALKASLTKAKSKSSAPLIDETQSHVVTSFGMYWQRSAIEWKPNAKLLGKQANADISVDFGKQNGIYILYDGREPIYIGRARDQPLGKRLFQHISDRLATRWDRFSWFGLCPVSEDGKLEKLPESYSSKQIITVLEALLIEATEPRQNRKAGDDWTDREYMQVIAPAIEKAKLNALLTQFIAQSAPHG